MSGVRIAVGVKAAPSPTEVADLALAGQLRLDHTGLDLRLDHLALGAQGFDEQALGFVAGLARESADGGGPAVEGIALSVDPASPAPFARAFELGFGSCYSVDSGAAGATDTATVARLLAAAVGQVGADLVVVGDASTVEGSGVVGGMVAALLDRPCLAGAETLELVDDGAKVAVHRRRPDGGVDRLEASLPAVVTVRSDAWEPVRPKAADVLAARGRTATVLTAAELGVDVGAAVGHGAERVGLRIDEIVDRCEQLDGTPAEVATAILARLDEELAAERPAPPSADGLEGADVVLLPDTPEGRAVAAAVAVRRGIPIVTGGTEVSSTRGDLVVSRPVHGGAAVERVRVTTPAVLTFGTVDKVDADPRVTVVPVSAADGRPLDKARFVIGVGAGIGTDETFDRIKALSEKLGAALGGSKVAVDRGWVASGQKIGLTGTGIAADVYLAIGISGASQHMAGCARAGTVVAVNCDRRAPIFHYARVGVVGDAAEIVDALLAAGGAAG